MDDPTRTGFGKKWICPNDRGLSLLARVGAGWSVNGQHRFAFERPPQLSDDEKRIILQVVKRAEDFERLEKERIGRLVEKQTKMRKHVDSSTASNNKCSGCGGNYRFLGLVSTGSKQCVKCNKIACTKCVVETAGPSSQKVWTCRVCYGENDIWKKSNAWFYQGVPEYTLPKNSPSTSTSAQRDSDVKSRYTSEWAVGLDLDGEDSSGDEKGSASIKKSKQPDTNLLLKKSPIHSRYKMTPSTSQAQALPSTSSLASTSEPPPSQVTTSKEPASQASTSHSRYKMTPSTSQAQALPSTSSLVSTSEPPASQVTTTKEPSSQASTSLSKQFSTLAFEDLDEDLPEVTPRDEIFMETKFKELEGKERSSVRHTNKQDIEAYLKQVQNANLQSSSAYLVVKTPPTAEQVTSSDASQDEEKAMDLYHQNTASCSNASGASVVSSQPTLSGNSDNNNTINPLPNLIQVARRFHQLPAVDLVVGYSPINSWLFINLLKVRNLTGVNPDDILDPFCRICFSPMITAVQYFRTRTVRHSFNPSFHETITFCNIVDADFLNCSISILVFDEDKYGNDLLGKARACLGTRLIKENELSFTCLLEQSQTALRTLFDDEGPTISLSLKYDGSRGTLVVSSVSCKNLQASRKSNPYLQLHFHPENNDRILRSQIQKHTLNPEFREEFILPASERLLARNSLVIEVISLELRHEDKFLGRLEIGPHSKGSRLAQWRNVLAHKNKAQTATHSLCIQPLPL